MKINDNKKTATGVVLLYTIITSAFSLLNKLAVLVVAQKGFGNSINGFFSRYKLWAIVVISNY